MSRWWLPHIHADRRPLLVARNRIQAELRAWFASRDFVEVDCGALVRSPGNEVHLHAFATDLVRPDLSRETLYLHTSPEFAAKKLLAAGEQRLFTFSKVFRNRERTALHAPEFTMLEWYRASVDYRQAMDDCIELLRLACPRQIVFRTASADPLDEPRRITVAQAFAEFAGVDLLRTLEDGHPNRAAFAAASPVPIAESDSWSDIFSRIMAEKIEPHLGLDRMTLLYEYPAPEAALARRCSHDDRVCERFELYACGVELANGYGELTDAAEQRHRFEADMATKQRIYGERYPIDETFLEAVAGMPAASGVALGFDRLVMLATGAPSIDQVIWTPFPD